MEFRIAYLDKISQNSVFFVNRLLYISKGSCGPYIYMCSSGPSFAPRCSLGPLFRWHIHVTCSKRLCTGDTFRYSSGPYGVDMSIPVQNPIVQTSTGVALAPFVVDTSRCSSSSYGVDMPRPAHGPVAHRCPVGVFIFLSLSDGTRMHLPCGARGTGLGLFTCGTHNVSSVLCIRIQI